jgi:hypothetical protein
VLPRRDLARATFVGLSPDLLGDTGLTGDPHRFDRVRRGGAARSSSACLLAPKGVNKLVTPLGMKSSSSDMASCEDLSKLRQPCTFDMIMKDVLLR